jgi:hypothetical protein
MDFKTFSRTRSFEALYINQKVVAEQFTAEIFLHLAVMPVEKL